MVHCDTTLRDVTRGTARGTTHLQGRLPELFPDQVYEGDGSTEWYVARFVITIPEGDDNSAPAPPPRHERQLRGRSALVILPASPFWA